MGWKVFFSCVLLLLMFERPERREWLEPDRCRPSLMESSILSYGAWTSSISLIFY